jgi:shikimate dehydrogenase
VKEAFGVDVKDLRVLILGAGGGAGRAVAVQSALVGCKSLVLANRTLDKAQAVMQEIRELGQTSQVSVVEMNEADLSHPMADCDLIVNATSLGMKSGDATLVPAAALESRHLVFDMVYRADGQTPLLADARQAGAKVVDGLTLLLHQGAISFEHWFGGEAPLEEMRAGLLRSQPGS